MPITASLGALTYNHSAQTIFSGSRYFPSTTGAGTPYGFYSLGVPNSVLDVTNSTGYTLEYRVNYTSLTNGSGPIWIGNFNTGFPPTYARTFVDSSGRLNFAFPGTPGASFRTNTGVITNSNWYGVALVFTTTAGTTTITMYVNGNRQNIQKNATGSYSNSQTFTSSTFTYNNSVNFSFFPQNQTPSQLVYFDEVRISTVNRYSGASYTLDTSPFIPDSDTQMLLHFDYSTVTGINTPIVDSSQNNIGITNFGTQANATNYVF